MASDASAPTGSAVADTGGLRLLLRLLPWVRPYRGSMWFMMGTALAAMLAQVLVPLVIEKVVDGPIRAHDPSGIWPLAALASGLGLAEAFFFYLRRRAMATAATGIETDLRRDLYRHVQRLPVAFHDRWPSGQLLSRMNSDLSTLRRFVGFAFIFLVANSVTCIIVAALLIHLQPLLGSFVALVMIPMAIATRYFERRYHAQARASQDITGDLTTTVEESAQGIRVIKAFGRGREISAGFTVKAGALRAAELAKVVTLSLFFAMLESYPQLVLAVATVGGAVAVVHGSLTLGAYVAFVTLYLRLIWPLASLGFLLAIAQEAASATRRIFEILDVEPAIVDPVAPVALPDSAQSSVQLRQVGFTFPDSQRAPVLAPSSLRSSRANPAQPVLRGVDLDIAPGETLALVGATGAGKTILTALIPRLYDVTEGAVLIDGVDVRDAALEDVRTRVAMAFEDATLFSASVRENLTLGRSGVGQAEVSAEDLAEAIDIAQAGFVYDLPAGLDTRIGEQGMSLSGGQRQRVALARAVLGRPKVLVLDDPLSALDVNTEALVEQALRRVLATTTALIVAHRPSTVLLADRVALLEDGRIADVGTHAELLARSPTYRHLLGSELSELSTA